MPKPSIFSRDYDEKMRKRKKRKRIISVVFLALILIVLFSVKMDNIFGKSISDNFSNIKEKILSITNSKIFTKSEEESKDNSNNIKEEANNKTNPKNEETNKGDTNNSVKEETDKEEISKEESYHIKLSNGQEIILVYQIMNNEKEYVKVLPRGLSFDISPSKKNIVIVEDKTQNMIIIDIHGNKKDITKAEYTSSKGNVFTKEKVLQSDPNYIWCSSPKYLDEDNIFFISQLPWFNKENIKYLWKYNISSNKYYHNLSPKRGEVLGADIRYGNRTQEGLEVIADGVKSVIK